MIWGYRNIFDLKNHTRKVNKFTEIFELYQVFIHNFLPQNDLIFPICLLHAKRICTFCSGGIKTYWAQKIIQAKLTKFIQVLSYIKSSCICFLCENVHIFPLYTLLTRRINTFCPKVLINFGSNPIERDIRE